MTLNLSAPCFIESDGGRAAAGFRGSTGDCVTRAIAIATGLGYQTVYDELWRRMRADDAASPGPRMGVSRKVYEAYLRDLGWAWTPTMQIGSGCKVHLRAAELPEGRLIVRLSRHMAAVINGVLYDTHDSARDGTRCVYGYFSLTPSPV